MPTEEIPVQRTLELSAETYQTIPSVVLNDLARGVLDPRDIALYALLKSYARGRDCCWPSYNRLGRQARCSVSSIQRSLKQLEQAGHIQRKSGGTTGKIFILTDVTETGVVRRRPVFAPPAVARSGPVSPVIQNIGLSTTIEAALVPVTEDAIAETDGDDPPF